jgi:hypothetical protein
MQPTEEDRVTPETVLEKAVGIHQNLREAFCNKAYGGVSRLADDLIVCALQLKQMAKGKKSPEGQSSRSGNC